MVINNILSYIAGVSGAFALVLLFFRPTGEHFWSALKACMLGGLIGITFCMLFLTGCTPH